MKKTIGNDLPPATLPLSSQEEREIKQELIDSLGGNGSADGLPSVFDGPSLSDGDLDTRTAAALTLESRFADEPGSDEDSCGDEPPPDVTDTDDAD